MIFTAHTYGLQPLEESIVRPREKDCHFSKEVEELSAEEMAVLTLPRLAPFLAGLAAKFLFAKDDVAMIAVQELIDGMDLDESWVSSRLQDCEPAVRRLILQEIDGKPFRMDHFSENEVTCFIRDQEEATHVKLITGYM
ncbi:hypothetical protein V2A60_003779 [Cordyceps javanica]